MIRLGLLDPPERVPYSGIGRGGPDEVEPWNRPETKALVRTVTQKSIVLLKNSAGLLPLDKTKLKTIAVVGPHANHVLLDWYSGTPPYSVSPRAGIEKAIGRDTTTSVKWVSNMGDAAIDVARSCDAVIVCIGNSPESEAGWVTVSSPSEGKEGIDRKAIVLQPDQEDFVRRVIAVNPRTVVVLIANFPYAMPWIAKSATTILQVTHASQELGNALADVIFGVVNPGGKLVQTWPKSLKQLPPMNDFDLRHGRTYMYFKGEPQYPFGYGSSYTTFELDNLRTSAGTLDSGGSIGVTVDLHNRGSREGDEVVQLYVRFPASKVERPLKQLRGFQRVTAQAGETKTVSLELRAADLSYWSPEGHAWVVEPGPVELLIGNSSSDKALTLRKTITVRPRN
jgi:beta-glucosidase